MTNLMPYSAPPRRQRRLGALHAADQAEFLDAMPELAAAADRVPFPDDRKPWRLRARSGSVELLADASYRTDDLELRRQIVIACGASLFNLRLAVTHLGQRPITTALPVPAEPDLLARIEPGGPAGSSDVAANLYLALTSHHTCSAPIAAPIVPQHLIVALASAVGLEGASLVPTDLTTDRPQTGWSEVSSGVVMLLVTPGDTTEDWLIAGQALQRLLLTAKTLWVSARFHPRALQVPPLRDQVRRSMCRDGYPQIVLELGQ